MNKSAKITEFDLLKYEQLYLNSQDSTEYKDIIENIQYDPSFTKDTIEAVHCLFCNRYEFNKGMLCRLLNELKQAPTHDDVKLFINTLYNFDKGKQSTENIAYLTQTDETPTDKLVREYENGFPPQVFIFFKAILETPQKMNRFDVVAILGIIHETKISANLNGFISQLIDFNQVSDEAEAKQLLNDNDLYETSLFKQHIKSG